jgi:serine/threonine-protein kinase
VLVGKIAYMAPEQVRGERSCPRTDVFSAGVVLWEALVGKRLFHDPALNRGEMLHALTVKPIERPSRLRRDIPLAVDDVVRRALDRNPECRFQTALEFAEALDAAAASMSTGGLGPLVRDVCGRRLAEKEALLREGLRASEVEATAELRTPLQRGALAVRLPSGPLRAFVAPLHERRGPIAAWLAGAALAGVCALPVLDAVRDGGRSEPPQEATMAARPSSASELGHASGLGRVPTAASLALTHAGESAPEWRGEPSSVSSREGGPSSEPPSNVHPGPALGSRARPVLARANEQPGRRKNLASRAGDASVVRRAPSRVHGERSTRCDPPTFVDSAGIRHFKKDCL